MHIYIYILARMSRGSHASWLRNTLYSFLSSTHILVCVVMANFKYTPVDSASAPDRLDEFEDHYQDLEGQDTDATYNEELEIEDNNDPARGEKKDAHEEVIPDRLSKCLAILFTIPLTTGIILFILYWVLWNYDGHAPALSLEEWRNGTYAQYVTSVNWIPNTADGLYSKVSDKGYQVGKWRDQEYEERVIAPLTISTEDERSRVTSAIPNKQITHVLLVTEPEKHWRHSSYAHYWVMEAGETSDNAKLLSRRKISTASWNPDGESLAYVLDHNIYIYSLETGESKQITFDGDTSIFNGIPDWVYEEEVFAGDSALWWSPKGEHLAYMRTNDSEVPKFPIPYFLSKAHDSDRAAAMKRATDPESPGVYPSLVELKYPKPGFPNPVVELWLFSKSSMKAAPVDLDTKLNEPIITELVWVGEQAVVKLIDRQSDHLEVWVVNPALGTAVRSRAYSSESLGGAWFEVTHNTIAVGNSGYIDRIDVDGYNHIGYFSPANATDPVILTRGNWEVLDKPIAVKEENGLVFFHANKESSLDSTIYCVSIDHPDEEPKMFPPHQSVPGINNMVFSSDGSHGTLTTVTPTEPITQWVIKLPSSFYAPYNRIQIAQNPRLKTLLESRHLLDNGTVEYGTLDLGDGLTVNYREIRPANFNSKKKHPLLFFNYGGPASQMVQHSLSIDFQRIYAETHDAVVVTVDPRGTTGRGRTFMSGVRDHLGEFEADDVIAAAKIFNNKGYIDEETTAIWGWSYGGFLTLKVLERDVDLAFKYGVAVAPVTDWALYDSIYTERYMHTPASNFIGYENSAVRNVTNLGRHNRFLVMHGTGDDNVHFQNTLNLLDSLDLAKIENYDVHVFPDSDHSISFHNANAMVYDRVDQWLANQQGKKEHKNHKQQNKQK